ncbi:g3839 [Coccomyxa elongata]
MQLGSHLAQYNTGNRRYKKHLFHWRLSVSRVLTLKTNISIAQLGKAQRAKLAAQLSPATGMQKSPDSQHSKEEMQLLQHANRELKQRNATLESLVKDQQHEQRAREKEIRAQQLAHTQTINHLFSENKALRAANRNRRHLDEDAGFADSDQ